jgi:copper chaperone CopZ
MNISLPVENIKCGGCAGTITKKLNAEFNTDSVKVEVEQGMVTINIEDNKRNSCYF